MQLAFIVGILFPLFAVLCTLSLNISNSLLLGVFVLAMAMIVVFLNKHLRLLFKGQDAFLATESEAQEKFLEQLPDRFISLAIVVTAGLGLFLELVLIRWQSSMFEFFAFYKNFGLMACFAGLGIGYGLAHKRVIPVMLSFMLLVFQMLLLQVLRRGVPSGFISSLMSLPFHEQSQVGASNANNIAEYVGIYSLLAVVFALTSLAFIPLGQICGKLMTRMTTLKAYGYNLLGSLLGVLLLFLMSCLWTPPAIWFAFSFAVLIFLASYRVLPLLISSVLSLVGLMVLCWPVSFGYEMVYSPYQLLERGPGPRGMSELRAAGQYYQRINDLSPAQQTIDLEAKKKANYYDLPYSVKTNAKSVAIVGAGTGNDASAAVRAGVDKIVAIEIDPAILAFGKLYHPEKPYENPHVIGVANDARAFLRSSPDSFDMIVFGLLDSHTLSSHQSNLRLDSYVYTVEALREARAHLNPSGVISLAFGVPAPEIAKKLYLMMKDAFDGVPPIAVSTGYDGSIAFLQSKEANLKIDDSLLQKLGLQEVSALIEKPQIETDISSDDWPFFYMLKRVYPFSYIPMIAMVIIMSMTIMRSFGQNIANFKYMPFFLMGTGFMLVETKAITELSLNFGNTWVVVGIVISSIMVMAFIANIVVEKLKFKLVYLPYFLLLASLGCGLWIAMSGGFPATDTGKLSSTITLTIPLFFSGILFSTLIGRCKDIPAAMSMNLLGAILGSVLEYSAMYLGYRALYVLAIAVYLGILPFLFGNKNEGEEVKEVTASTNAQTNSSE
jgi:spermidine synthase